MSTIRGQPNCSIYQTEGQNVTTDSSFGRPMSPTLNPKRRQSVKTNAAKNRRPVDSVRSSGLPSVTSSDSHQFRSVVMSCVEGRAHAKGEIGLAVIDLKNPVMILSQFSDNSLYECLQTKLDIYKPFDIIIPDSLVKEQFNSNNNSFHNMIAQCFPLITITTFDRKLFNETKGLELIQYLCCEELSAVDIAVHEKYYCLSACSALINYIQNTMFVKFASHSLKIAFEGSLNTMNIDPTTARLLELVVNLNDPKSNDSLFGIINKTKTRSGFRLLRSNILQPPTELDVIQARLDMIQEIISSSKFFDSIESILNQFCSVDVEQLLSNLVQIQNEESIKSCEKKIENAIQVKYVIKLIEPLISVLSQNESNVFVKFIDTLSDPRFGAIMDSINEVLEDSCNFTKGVQNMKLERCHAIKRGKNAFLDIAREAYSEFIDDFSDVINDYKIRYDLHIKTCYSTSRGYHAQITIPNAHKIVRSLPTEFNRISVCKNAISFTTDLLLKKNNRINMAVEEIYLMSNETITSLIENIRSNIGCLYNISEIISKLDLVFSFAYQCTVSQCVRPDFSDSLAIKQGRHPILEKILIDKPVPNDIYMSEDNNFTIITGPNMSGKSTLLRQVAVLQVMAQIGSYIPAEFASFRVCDKLFSRIGSNDEIETNCSTFMIEMKEISYILRNITNNSLVVIDELGRGTAVEEGIGLCFAICEELLKTNAFTLFVTHFFELTKLENFYFNVSNYNFKFEEKTVGNKTQFSYTHILEPGISQQYYYGIQLAELSSMPRNIISMAKEFAHILNNTQKRVIVCDRMNATNRVKYKFTSALFQAVKNGQDLTKDFLIQLKNNYLKQIEDIEDDNRSYDTISF